MLYIAWLKYKGRRYLIPDLIHRDCSKHKIWVVFQGHHVISHIVRLVLIRGWYIYKFMQCMLWVDAIRTLIVDIPVSLISRHNEFFHRYLKYSEKIYGMCGSTQVLKRYFNILKMNKQTWSQLELYQLAFLRVNDLCVKLRFFALYAWGKFWNTWYVCYVIGVQQQETNINCK